MVALLNCDPAPSPCRGFTGDCSLLQAQFTGVQDASGNVAIPDDYVCTAFPDDSSQVDTILVRRNGKSKQI